MNERYDVDQQLSRAGEKWRAGLPDMDDPYPAFRRTAARERRTVSLARAAVSVVIVVLVGGLVSVTWLTRPPHQLVGVATPGASPGMSALPVSSPSVSASASPIATPQVASSASPQAEPSTSPTDDYEARLHRQARLALSRWDEVMADAPPDAIVFVRGLTRGGGWRDRGADERKSAFLAGRLEATVQLATEPPPPGMVVWPDGSTTTAELMSAAAALEGLIREMEGGGAVCTDCRPLEVIGAHLVEGEAATSRGTVTVPLWQFEFAVADEPQVPITHVAVKDRVAINPAEWEEQAGPNALGTPIEAAYGSPNDSSLTVLFVGAPWLGDVPCGQDYTAEAVESELAIVVIVTGQSQPADLSAPAVCPALGAGRTAVAQLAAPLGERTVLEVQFGTPVELRPEEPPADEISR
jgi:hypothetical protein